MRYSIKKLFSIREMWLLLGSQRNPITDTPNYVLPVNLINAILLVALIGLILYTKSLLPLGLLGLIIALFILKRLDKLRRNLGFAWLCMETQKAEKYLRNFRITDRRLNVPADNE